jgi:Predicted membrane protein
MKHKKKFLDDLATELESRDIDNKDVIEYYDEIIDARVATGKSESSVVKSLGEIEDILQGIEIDQRLNETIKRPTVSNGVKALVAILGVLSLPFLIPVVAVIFALIITFGAIIISLIISAAAMIFAVIVMAIGVSIGVFTDGIPILFLPLAIGIVLIFVPLCIEAIRGLVFVTRKSIAWTADRISRKKSNKGVKK